MSAWTTHLGARIWLRLRICEVEAAQQALAAPPGVLREAASTNADVRELLERADRASRALLACLGELRQPFDLGRKQEGHS